jgi:hypothetical protein
MPPGQQFAVGVEYGPLSGVAQNTGVFVHLVDKERFAATERYYRYRTIFKAAQDFVP